MTAATLLRASRARVGWTQRELARRSGVAQPSLSDIESGVRDTTVSKLEGVLRAAGSSLVVVPSVVPSVAAWAAQLADRVPADPGGVEKGLVQVADDLRSVEGATRVALCVTPPASTGLSWLDAVLAAIVEHSLTEDRLPVPGWVSEPWRCAAEPWDLITVPALQEAARATTPDEFRRRNVFVPADFLASV
ncbi:MAG: helix-turn-helix transcriptional regulator [Acidimicrobiales bacterium]|nr:helix-turn-helix transcriptional regulator [Acidimicrobiales bacterium]